METKFCILCDGKLEDEELPVGFCIHCEAVMTRELIQEASTEDRPV